MYSFKNTLLTHPECARQKPQYINVQEVRVGCQRTQCRCDACENHRVENDCRRSELVRQESADECGEEISPKVGAQQNTFVILRPVVPFSILKELKYLSKLNIPDFFPFKIRLFLHQAKVL